MPLQDELEADLTALRGPLREQLDQREAAARLVITGLNGQGIAPSLMIAALDRAGCVFQPASDVRRSCQHRKLRLIRDPAVRAALISYYDSSALNSQNELIRREIWYGYRPTIPEVLDPLVLAEVTLIEGDNTSNSLEAFASAIPADLAVAGLNSSALRERVAFRAGIGRALEYTYVQRRQENGRNARAEAVLKIVQQAQD